MLTVGALSSSVICPLAVLPGDVANVALPEVTEVRLTTTDSFGSSILSPLTGTEIVAVNVLAGMVTVVVVLTKSVPGIAVLPVKS
ncbi:hypothetical protein D3C80_381130 [compost metagenome]